MTADTSSNIAGHLVRMAQQQPDVPALFSQLKLRRGKLHYSTCTFRELNDQSNALARGFSALGIGAGTRTAVCLRPGVDFFATTFALFKIGAVPVLIDPGIGLKNFGRCLANAQPTAFIGIPLAHALRRALRWAKSTIRINITAARLAKMAQENIVQPGAREGRRRLPTSEHLPSELLNFTPPSPLPLLSSAAAILFTSGSTGPAKGVFYTHANFNAQIAALRDAYNIEPGEIDLATFPLFGLFGPALGMTTVIPTMNFTRPGFVNPHHIIEPIQQLHITNMFGSPALLDRVGRYGEAHDIKLPSLRRVISAGAPASTPVLARFSKMLNPETQIFTPYGATEALPVCSIGSHEILRETAALTDRGKGVCVGRPLANVQLRIIKITDDSIAAWSPEIELPAGQVGEIAVQGPVVTAEYFNNPAANEIAKIPMIHMPPAEESTIIYPPSKIATGTNRGGGGEGGGSKSSFFHRMGDVGYLDAAGRLWFCGRKSQRVRLSTGDLNSIPVEAIFNTHPHVQRSALVGITRDGQTIPVICIERSSHVPFLSKHSLTGELIAIAKQHTHTAAITHFLYHPRFPVDIRHNAKINREKLAIWAARKLR